VQLVSKISNLCARDPPTLQIDGLSQTDGQTDDMQSQYRALHYSASRGKNAFVRFEKEVFGSLGNCYIATSLSVQQHYVHMVV